MLDESRREELTAKLQELSDSDKGSSEPAAAEETPVESQQAEPAEQEDDKTEAEASPADGSEPTEASEDRHQSGAQKRISELVRQRNHSNEELRSLQEQFAQMQEQIQHQERTAQHYAALQQQQTAEHDEYGEEYAQPQANPQLEQLQAEFNHFRDTQVQTEVRTQLEQELGEAIEAHPGVDAAWMRRQLIDAVRLDGSANLMEVAEYYSAFIGEIGSTAVEAFKNNTVSNDGSPAAPPRPTSTGAASADLSNSGDQPLTREQARERAVARLRALG